MCTLAELIDSCQPDASNSELARISRTVTFYARIKLLAPSVQKMNGTQDKMPRLLPLTVECVAGY